MAEIRVERKTGGHAWMWILLALALLIAAALLLNRRTTTNDRTRTTPANVSSAETIIETPAGFMITAAARMQEV